MLLKDSGYITQQSYDSIYNDNIELLKLLISILKTLKQQAQQ